MNTIPKTPFTSKPIEAPKATYEQTPDLPAHFSALSAQKSGKGHNEEAHKKMLHELHSKGYQTTEVQGHYGEPEKSVMVHHHGSPADQKTLESIAFGGFGQESIVHSSADINKERNNKLVYNDESRKPEHGKGVEWGNHLSDFYTELPSGHRFQLKLGDVEKSESHEKPHYYGKIDGIHVFHGTHGYHRQLVGHHVDNPSENEFKTALKDAKDKKSGVVIVHGAPPDSLRSRIHNELGPVLPAKVKKSDIGDQLRDLKTRVETTITLEKKIDEFVDRFQKTFGAVPEEHLENISGKELLKGLQDPEHTCVACEYPVGGCSCYAGLPKPEIHFDGNSLSIFFKSEYWDEETRTSFVSDLKRRAGRIINRKSV